VLYLQYYKSMIIALRGNRTPSSTLEGSRVTTTLLVHNMDNAAAFFVPNALVFFVPNDAAFFVPNGAAFFVPNAAAFFVPNTLVFFPGYLDRTGDILISANYYSQKLYH
jgi:hypothetical protein